MNLDKEDLEAIATAVGRARDTYNKETRKDGTDPAYRPITIIVHELTMDFEEIGQITYKEMDFTTKGNCKKWTER